MIYALIIALTGISFYLLSKKLYSEGEPEMSIDTIETPESDLPTAFKDWVFSWCYQYGDKYGVDPLLVFAVIRHESNFNPNAVNPNDPSYGLMQITKAVTKDFGKPDANLFDPETNIEIGTWFLAYLVNKHGLDIGVQMYNCWETGYLKNGVRVPNYLAKVKGYYQEYKNEY